jgi:NAD(P)-dependent dehydrogenase (short-subunit alcohol dehydrogenase family)
MTTIAIIGAGPGLGQATARRFGAEGFSVALTLATRPTSMSSSPS